MTVGQFKKWISENNVSDAMQIILIDTTTDSTDDMNYFISTEDNIMVDDVFPADDDYEKYGLEYGEPVGKALMILFENKLNENPI